MKDLVVVLSSSSVSRSHPESRAEFVGDEEPLVGQSVEAESRAAFMRVVIGTSSVHIR